MREAPSYSLCCAPNADMSTLADGVPGVTLAARELMRKGADHVKICTSGGVSSPTDKLESVQFSPAEIRAIVEVVQDMGGTLVTSHAYTNAAIRRAVENGVRGIEHGNLLDRDTAKLLGWSNEICTSANHRSQNWHLPHTYAHDFDGQRSSPMERNSS